MQQVWNILLRGVEAVLPVTLTLYLIYWVSDALERILRQVMTVVVPEQYYVPGGFGLNRSVGVGCGPAASLFRGTDGECLDCPAPVSTGGGLSGEDPPGEVDLCLVA